MNSKKGAGGSRRSASAVDLFEKAMKALGKRDYEKAQDHFEALLASHPDERDMAERARLYRDLCVAAREKKPVYRPKTFEDLLAYGVFLHNQGDFAQALKLFGDAAAMRPKSEHVLYCTAASAAQSGDAAAALRALRAAFQVDPSCRAQARVDPDFEALRDSDEFLELLDSEVA
jgi:tetratricopeptide (TPR) repeat protein